MSAVLLSLIFAVGWCLWSHDGMRKWSNELKHLRRPKDRKLFRFASRRNIEAAGTVCNTLFSLLWTSEHESTFIFLFTHFGWSRPSEKRFIAFWFVAQTNPKFLFSPCAFSWSSSSVFFLYDLCFCFHQNKMNIPFAAEAEARAKANTKST